MGLLKMMGWTNPLNWMCMCSVLPLEILTNHTYLNQLIISLQIHLRKTSSEVGWISRNGMSIQIPLIMLTVMITVTNLIFKPSKDLDSCAVLSWRRLNFSLLCLDLKVPTPSTRKKWQSSFISLIWNVFYTSTFTYAIKQPVGLLEECVLLLILGDLSIIRFWE